MDVASYRNIVCIVTTQDISMVTAKHAVSQHATGCSDNSGLLNFFPKS